MATVSLCMIVKNEERVLARCLDSIHDLVDEIVIVDTGSTDSTKEIAGKYTDKVYDFEWIDDFSAARNYSFSKCTMDYIYTADADEYLTAENRLQFKVLKENIFPEIEIVQMMYETISNDTVLNVYREYRPKLYKRLREFVWVDPVHETVRLDPVVFDSDVVITHAPESNHAGRDFSIFEKEIKENGGLSANLNHMYAMELYKCGTKEALSNALTYFINVDTEDDEYTAAYVTAIIIKCLRVTGHESFEAFAKDALEAGFADVSEINFELGKYYLDKKDYGEAAFYFRASVYGSSPVLDVHSGGDTALKMLIEACEKVIGDYEEMKAGGDIGGSDGSDAEMEKIIAEYQSVVCKYKVDLSEWKAPGEIVQ